MNGSSGVKRQGQCLGPKYIPIINAPFVLVNILYPIIAYLYLCPRLTECNSKIPAFSTRGNHENQGKSMLIKTQTYK
jgi:hypothetical protein